MLEPISIPHAVHKMPLTHAAPEFTFMSPELTYGSTEIISVVCTTLSTSLSAQLYVPAPEFNLIVSVCASPLLNFYCSANE